MDQRLKVRAKIVKVLDENIGINFCDFGFHNGFLERKSEAKQLKADKLKFLRFMGD